jgi:hypothetical protein
MPRVRRRDKHRLAVSIEQIHEYLESGNCWMFRFDNIKPSADDVSEWWAEHGADVTAMHIEQLPWTRPWAWWELVAPEPRRVIGGHEDPEDGFAPWEHCTQAELTGPGPHPAWEKKLAELLKLKEQGDDRRTLYYGCPDPVQSGARYESEFDFLDRLDLFTAEERELSRIADSEATDGDDPEADQ